MVGRIVVYHDGHMTYFLCVATSTIKHQIASFQLFRPVDHAPSLMQLVRRVIAQVIAKAAEHEVGKARTVELVGTMSGWHIRDTHEPHGIIDNAVLMATKTTLRNGKPIVLAPFTNDALSLNGENIMKLMSKKNFFFVPFGQDDPIKKPTSMTSNLKKLKSTIINALEYKQIQPVIIQNFESK